MPQNPTDALRKATSISSDPSKEGWYNKVGNFLTEGMFSEEPGPVDLIAQLAGLYAASKGVPAALKGLRKGGGAVREAFDKAFLPGRSQDLAIRDPYAITEGPDMGRREFFYRSSPLPKKAAEARVEAAVPMFNNDLEILKSLPRNKIGPRSQITTKWRDNMEVVDKIQQKYGVLNERVRPHQGGGPFFVPGGRVRESLKLGDALRDATSKSTKNKYRDVTEHLVDTTVPQSTISVAGRTERKPTLYNPDEEIASMVTGDASQGYSGRNPNPWSLSELMDHLSEGKYEPELTWGKIDRVAETLEGYVNRLGGQKGDAYKAWFQTVLKPALDARKAFDPKNFMRSLLNEGMDSALKSSELSPITKKLAERLKFDVSSPTEAVTGAVEQSAEQGVEAVNRFLRRLGVKNPGGKGGGQ